MFKSSGAESNVEFAIAMFDSANISWVGLRIGAD